jgi:tetratricopeptide (TPR) repeat protein
VSVPLTGDVPFDPHEELEEGGWELVREAVRAVIAGGEEPVDLDALATAAPVAAAFDGLDVAAAADRVETLRWALLDVDEAFRAADGRILDRGRLVDGLTLTRRVTAAELDSGRLELRHDLSPLHMIDEDALPMVAGDAVVELPSREELDRTTGQLTWRLRLPAGALDGVEADQLVALRWSDGVLSLEPVDGPFDAGSVPEVLRETRAALVAQVDRLELHDGEIVEVGDLVLAALARDAAAFRQPVPPLSELLPLAGLSSHGDFVADGDFDWDRWRDQRHAIGELHRLQYAHDLDRDEAALVYATLQLLQASADGEQERLAGPPAQLAVAALDRPRLLNAFLGETLRERPELAAHLPRFVDGLLPHAARPERAGLLVLLAEHATAEGRLEDAERHLRAARDSDPDHPMALFELARIASDRGDARRALGHLRRLDLPEDDGFVAMMARYAQAGPMSAGRNDPCPCGSGRKYKVCCAKRDGWPLTERVPWLLHKLRWMVATGTGFATSLALAELIAADPDDPEAVFELAVSNPFVHDLGLFEGGWLETFLEERGVLLPADELELARSWVGRPRRLFEVTALRGERGLQVTDLRSGDRVGVRELLGRHQVKVGTSVLARLLPDGDGHQFSLGVAPVELRLRAPLLDLLDEDPGAEELAAFFTPRPAELTNTDGDPLVVSEGLRGRRPGRGAPAPGRAVRAGRRRRRRVRGDAAGRRRLAPAPRGAAARGRRADRHGQLRGTAGGGHAHARGPGDPRDHRGRGSDASRRARDPPVGRPRRRRRGAAGCAAGRGAGGDRGAPRRHGGGVGRRAGAGARRPDATRGGDGPDPPG